MLPCPAVPCPWLQGGGRRDQALCLGAAVAGAAPRGGGVPVLRELLALAAGRPGHPAGGRGGRGETYGACCRRHLGLVSAAAAPLCGCVISRASTFTSTVLRGWVCCSLHAKMNACCWGAQVRGVSSSVEELAYIMQHSSSSALIVQASPVRLALSFSMHITTD